MITLIILVLIDHSVTLNNKFDANATDLHAIFSIYTTPTSTVSAPPQTLSG